MVYYKNKSYIMVLDTFFVPLENVNIWDFIAWTVKHLFIVTWSHPVILLVIWGAPNPSDSRAPQNLFFYLETTISIMGSWAMFSENFKV